MSMFPPDDFGDFGEPMMVSTYDTGTAAIDFEGMGDGQVLDNMAPGSQLDSLIGASVVWKNDAGWNLALTAYDMSSFGGLGPPDGTVTIGRIEGHEYWIAGGYMDESRCILTTDEISDAGIKGSAMCSQLRWMDGTSQFSGLGTPAYVEGQDPFDVQVTFEAEPGNPTSHS